jgi:hypothetical protein
MAGQRQLLRGGGVEKHDPGDVGRGRESARRSACVDVGTIANPTGEHQLTQFF